MTHDDALTALVRDRWRALVGYGSLVCGSTAEAEDLVSEAVLRTFGRRGADDLEDPEAFVRTAMLRLHIDGYRRRRRWLTVRGRVATAEQVEATDAVSADQLDVRQALAALPPRERACVVLRFYDDLTVPAIAVTLGIAPGSVKRYLSQASSRLQELLVVVDLHDDDLDPADDGAVTTPTREESR